MSIVGIFTNEAINKAREVLNNEGFQIYPTSFGVSTVQDPLNPTRVGSNAGMFYQGIISTRIVVSTSTIKFVCTVPPQASSIPQEVREIYLFGQSGLAVDYLMAIGHPSPAITYDPNGSITLELELSLSNVDFSSNVVFQYTQAQEIQEHNTDPNAHPEMIQGMNKAGIFIKTGGVPFAYNGQAFDEKANFQGTPASVVHSGITISSIWNGTRNNGKTVLCDGIKNIGLIVIEFNALNVGNEITHTGSGLSVPSPATLNLSGGTLLVNNNNVVYRDTDGFYKKALADGTIKSKVAGIAQILESDPPTRIVRASGFIGATTGFPVGTDLYLHAVSAGSVTDQFTAIKLGHVVGTGHILIGTGGGGGGGGGFSEFDAVVSNESGLGRYSTTQEAVDKIPDGGSILIAKQEILTNTIDTLGKKVKFVFSGVTDGWIRFAGTVESQSITFSQSPTSGTWRIYWNSQVTPNLPYTASALDVETAMNALTGTGLPVIVTGNYLTGFSIVYDTFVGVPEPFFLDAGLDGVQTISFDSVPDDGTFRLTHNGMNTVNISYHDDAAFLEAALEALPNLSDVEVTGSFSTGFNIRFKTLDSKKPQTDLIISANSLTLVGSLVVITRTTPVVGEYPASNLKNGSSPIVISVQTVFEGNPIGAATAIQLTADGSSITGYGTIEGFITGIDLNGKKCIIETNFINCSRPISGNEGMRSGVDYLIENSLGLNHQSVITVGQLGILANLDSALYAAHEGDKIVVLEDQLITTQKLYDKNVELEFKNGARLVVDADISGSVITFDNSIRTRDLHLVCTHGYSFNSAFEFLGIGQHHTNIGLELAGAGVSFINAFKIGAGSFIHYIDGWIKISTATVTTVLLNSSGVVSHNAIIRDKDHGITHDATTASIKELKGLPNWYDTPWSNLKLLREYQNLFFSNGGLISWGVGGTDTLRFTDQILINVAGRATTYTLGIVGNNDYVLADGDCLYVEIPETGTVATATVSSIGSVPVDPLVVGQNPRTMVLFFRKFQTILGLMDLPELSVGETATIGLDMPSVIRNRLGVLSDKGYMPYNSLNSISENDDYATAISKVDHKVMLLLNDSPVEQSTVTTSLTTALVEVSLNTSVGWVSDNTIPDLQVFRNGQKLIASPTSLSVDGDYIKTTYPAIKFFYDIPSNSKITFRNERTLIEYTAKRSRFVSEVTGISGINVAVGSPYNPVSGKLHVYRNGIRILPAFTLDQFGVLATLTGYPYMKYMESNSTAISISSPATSDEVFTFVNQSVSHLYRTAYSSITTTISLNFVATNAYLRVWKNGVLMVENSTNGIPSSQNTYTLSVSTVTLSVAALPTDLFLVESLGLNVGQREDKTGLTGTVITLTIAYVVASAKLLVFKNGILLYRSVSLGDIDDRYSETSANSITLGAACTASDIFSFIQEEV